MSPQQESSEQEWPEAVELALSGAGHVYVPAPSLRTERRRYLPESSPQVLSKEDARLLDAATTTGVGSGEEARKLEELLDDLRDWADS